MWVKSALAEAVVENPRRARLSPLTDVADNDLSDMLANVLLYARAWDNRSPEVFGLKNVYRCFHFLMTPSRDVFGPPHPASQRQLVRHPGTRYRC